MDLRAGKPRPYGKSEDYIIMQDNKNSKKSKPPKQPITAALETFALTGGEKNPKSGTTIPTEEGVIAAKEFVEENKK